MAAPNEPIQGVKLLTLVNSTLVGAQENATLNVPQELRELITKNNFGWVSNLPGMQEWSVEHSGYVLNNSGEAFISNNDASFEIEADFTQDSTDNPQWHTVQFLDSITATLETGIAETGGLDKALWRYITTGERSMQIDVEGSYLDPAASVGEEWKEILTRKDNGETINARVTIAGRTFTGQVAPGDLTIEGAAEAEDATISASFASDGQVTKGGTAFGTGVALLFDAFFNESSVSVAMEYQDNGSAVTGSTTFTGSGYLSSLEVGAAHGEEATLDATIEGDGPLSRSQIT